MRHPVWILNSAFLFLLLSAVVFVIFSQVSTPEWEEITPSTYTTPTQKRASEITISKIYEHDLFDTYEREIIAPETPNYLIPMPPAPEERRLNMKLLAEPKPEFLDPLKITLKGIITVAGDDTKNRAIIADNTTKKETVYKVGETIEDAQLIKIFNKKVIFLRSNGQQEVLYLRPKDAQMDPVYAAASGFKNIAQEVTEHVYLVNPREFANQVKSLAQFIDLLDLTTVYKQGQNVGCRVGIIEPNSLGDQLGFKRGDIIEAVNGRAATDTQSRLQIYKEIMGMQTNDTIFVDLLRNNDAVTLTFTLEDFKAPKASAEGKADAGRAAPSPARVHQEQVEMLKERHKFAPTLQEIREQERENMFKRGRSPRNNVTSNFAE